MICRDVNRRGEPVRRLSRCGARQGISAKASKDAFFVSRRGLLRSCSEVLLSFLFRPLWVQADGGDKQEVDYSDAGPFQPIDLPRLEHTCTVCFPQCVGDRCLIRIQVTYPKSGSQNLQKAPYPLAIISGGFLTKGEKYTTYAEKLASWGYVAVLYDKVESVIDPLDDVLSKNVIHEVIDWTQSDPLMQQITDSNAVYLIGHSRGGKLSVLAATEDERVKSLCLIDPVDNTIYAPLAPGYPSAVDALKSTSRVIPILAIGSELGSDCAPPESNYLKFYSAASGPSAEVVIQNAGHFQFLDDLSTLDHALCLTGRTEDARVRDVTQALMVAWGEATMKQYTNRPYYVERNTVLPALTEAGALSRSQPSPGRKGAALPNSLGLLLQDTIILRKRSKNLSFSFF